MLGCASICLITNMLAFRAKGLRRTPSPCILLGIVVSPSAATYAGGHFCGRTQMDKNLIVSDPRIALGKPVIVGTRITVELILDKLAAGESIEDLLDAHPSLTREAIQAAIAFAADILRSDRIYPVKGSAA